MVAARWTPLEAASLPSAGKESFAVGSYGNRSKKFCMISHEAKPVQTAFVCARFCIVMTSKQTKRQGVKLGGLAELVQVYLVSGETGKAPLVSAVRGQVQSQCPRNADIATSSEVCLGHLLPESEPEWSEVVPSVCTATWRGPRRGGRRPAGRAGPPASPPRPWRSHRMPGRRALPIRVQSRAEPCFRVFLRVVSVCADSGEGSSAGSDFRLRGRPPVATSRRRCHEWALGAKGLGPTLPGGSGKSPSRVRMALPSLEQRRGRAPSWASPGGPPSSSPRFGR